MGLYLIFSCRLTRFLGASYHFLFNIELSPTCGVPVAKFGLGVPVCFAYILHCLP